MQIGKPPVLCFSPGCRRSASTEAPEPGLSWLATVLELATVLGVTTVLGLTSVLGLTLTWQPVHRNRSIPTRRRERPGRFLKITKHRSQATMDLRLILVAAPILLAASWAVFHIGRAAVGQLQLFIKRAA
jgi:photosystem II PsbY protein